MDDLIVMDAPLAELPSQINAAVADADRHARGAVDAALRAGRLLNSAKAMVPAGDWERWVSENCTTVALRTAQAYMRLAKQMQALPPAEAQRVALLPVREAVKAITTGPAAPRRSAWVVRRSSRSDAERSADKLRRGADALRKVARGAVQGMVRREEIARIRAKLKEALDMLDQLERDDAAEGQP